jgi:hypothetical protein
MGTNARKDYFDQWWEWATKPAEIMLTIPAVIHSAVMALSREERRDRQKVNDAVCRSAAGNFGSLGAQKRRFEPGQ